MLLKIKLLVPVAYICNALKLPSVSLLLLPKVSPPVIVSPDFDTFVFKSVVLAFVAILLVIVVAKLGSSPNAAANSFSVSNVAGAVSTTFATAVLT